MANKRTRLRHRRDRLAELQESINQATIADGKAAGSRLPKPGHGELYRLVKNIDRRGTPVWGLEDTIIGILVANVADKQMADEIAADVRAMLAQIVAPTLAGMTRSSIYYPPLPRK